LKKGILAVLGGLAISLTGPVAGAQNWPSIHGPTDTPKYPAAGSTYVPLTSWVYPAIEKLAAMRYIRSDFRGTRPWARTECARLTDEAANRITEKIRAGEDVSEFVADTLKELQNEFAPELDVIGGDPNRSLQMESVYTRVMSISGPMLDDSFHFGQTISNDFGRPDRRGTNVIAGASARATFGPFFAYVDQEYQHAPGEPAYSAAMQQTVLNMDLGQAYLPHGGPAINRLQSMDTYAGFNFKNWQVSFGRQSLWWGTSDSGGMLMSNNAPPINGLHIDRAVPFRLPWILGFLGPMHVSFVVGKLGGHVNTVTAFCPLGVAICGQTPWMQNTRISFKMTDRVEFGVSHAAIFGGEGFTNGAGVFFRALIPINRLANQLNSQFENKQYMSWDLNVRISPSATWYAEFLGSDDPYPFSQISRTAIDTGMYFPRLPRLSNKLDLRIEGAYTSSPLNTDIKPNIGLLHYWGVHWQGGYTNDQFIIGNAVGRDARRYGGWLTYHLSPKDLVQVNVAHAQVSGEFVPGGANWTDYDIVFQKEVHSSVYLSTFVQVEHLNYPILFAQRSNNVTISTEFGYRFRGRETK
jgi:hypothetical protein